jgi:predicted transcriptional regulator
MKMTFDQKAAEERMLPGVLTSQGFLGSDSRRLADIIEADEEQFRALGLDFGQVADRLDTLAREGEKGLGEPITVEGVWLVKSDEARGKIPCPFQDASPQEFGFVERTGTRTG